MIHGKVQSSNSINIKLNEIKLREIEYTKKNEALICRLKLIFIVKIRKRLRFNT